MAEPFKLLVLPGDGIGPEVVAAALEVFEQLCRRENIDTRIESDLLHGAAWEAYRCFCRDQTPAMSQLRDLGGNADTERVCATILSALA